MSPDININGFLTQHQHRPNDVISILFRYPGDQHQCFVRKLLFLRQISLEKERMERENLKDVRQTPTSVFLYTVMYDCQMTCRRLNCASAMSQYKINDSFLSFCLIKDMSRTTRTSTVRLMANANGACSKSVIKDQRSQGRPQQGVSLPAGRCCGPLSPFLEVTCFWKLHHSDRNSTLAVED